MERSGIDNKTGLVRKEVPRSNLDIDVLTGT